eukprot:GHVQ01041246.1.p1 GENE.GHVQ01041246.1~~GHVQ01041246.1.p1  ORF type:complete len:272 (-),score=27.22 GHVQ01041246.1:1619-2434(-)
MSRSSSQAGVQLKFWIVLRFLAVTISAMAATSVYCSCLFSAGKPLPTCTRSPLPWKGRYRCCTAAVPTAKPKVIFVVGGPGTGKGTQCEKISKYFRYSHISAGECLRIEQAKPESQFACIIGSCLRRGHIVPVEVTVKLIRQRMMELGWEKRRFMIDGFPRNEDNVRGWEAEMKDGVDVLCCLFFYCGEGEMQRRLIERGKNSGRTDDNAETIVQRLRTHRKTTKPIADYFGKKNLCKTIDASRGVDEVWRDVSDVLKELEKSEITLAGHR